MRARGEIDGARLVRQAAIGAALVTALAQLWLQARGSQYGFDFRGGIWGAGRAVLAGRSPYPLPDAAVLLAHPNGFINPPPLALLGVLLAPLPFAAAVAVFNLLCVAGLVLALRLVGMRDWMGVLVAVCCFPFVSSLALGQPDGLLALGAAIAWRQRGTTSGALAVSALIAAKLLAWPLVLWLLATRRAREAAIAAAGAIAITLGSWACLGFRGLTQYPRLLNADTRVFETHAHSLMTALARSGLALGPAAVLSVILAAGAAAAVVALSRRSDLGIFTAALTLGILASPIVWQHYFVVLLISLGATRRTRDPLCWVLMLSLWISPAETPATLAQAWLIPVLAVALALRIGVLARSVREPASFTAPEAREPSGSLAVAPAS